MCGRYESDLRSLPGIDRFAELVGARVVDAHDRRPVIVEMSDLDAWLTEPGSELPASSPEGRLVVG